MIELTWLNRDGRKVWIIMWSGEQISPDYDSPETAKRAWQRCKREHPKWFAKRGLRSHASKA